MVAEVRLRSDSQRLMRSSGVKLWLHLSSTLVVFGSGGLLSLHLQPSPSVHASVVPVLDCVVAASWKTSGDVGPFLSQSLNQVFNVSSFLGSYWLVHQGWFKVLMVSLAALFWRARADDLGDCYPVERAILSNELHEMRVLAL